MSHIKDLPLKDMKEAMAFLDEKPFRAEQVFRWIYRQKVESLDDMRNISAAAHEKLASSELTAGGLMLLTVKQIKLSDHDNTRKYLFETRDGNLIEAVYMEYFYGDSVCISSQAGCKMGCSFCASGMTGLSRDLTPGEMMDQYLLVCKDTGKDIRHIVLMGTGEPMDNYDNVIKFLSIITEPIGVGLGRRQITVSTCGLLPGMERYLEEMPQANLAISLHAPNDDIRKSIMPIANAYSMDDLISFARRYVDKIGAGHKITLEYALIRGVNDAPEHAAELAKKLKGLNCLVNIIPLNPVKESGLTATGKKAKDEFAAILYDAGIRTTVRRRLGTDVDAACGQLRLRSGD